MAERTALIGCTGFVGQTLARQTSFDDNFHSTNIHQIDGQEYDLLVCAGAPAQKWVANRDPAADWNNLSRLISHLAEVSAKRAVLVSTVDVFRIPLGVDEETAVEIDDLHPYGLHRRRLEEFFRDRFSTSLIVRLPGLVGPGLRKNVLYDLAHDNNVPAIDTRCVFQFYPTVNLWYDIQIALAHDLSLCHLTAEPLLVKDICRLAFGQERIQSPLPSPVQYDMRTRFAQVFGATGGYQYSARESLTAIRAYVQSELETRRRRGAN